MQPISPPAAEADLQPGLQRTQDNLQMRQTYFDALFAPDLDAYGEKVHRQLGTEGIPHAPAA